MDASFANKAMIFLIWLMALTFCPSARVEAGCSEEQNRALLEIRNSTHGLLFADLDGSRDCCSKSNILCDDDGKVIRIFMQDDYVKPPSIFKWYPNMTLFTLFNELDFLDLSSMNIGGELQVSGMGNLPSSIFSNQSKITTFEVSGNRLEGVLSFSILANASSLYHLDLSNNYELEIETESPSWVPTFQLRKLYLANCSLNKKNGHVVPTFISTQYLLYSLDLSNSPLEGSVPCHLFFNTNITKLLLSGNKIDGSFLDCSANGTSPLEWLDISGNHVKGHLPENIGYLLPNLYGVDMSSNALEGNTFLGPLVIRLSNI
ncbi:receptor-like protein 14 [Juglans regia]|uniref:Receptor-like protein 14 n=1 Tax=Juglans regia TaxID=51240 RepID=A0A6P9DWM6_JUGRE|nr:receptor-like protein 14 [Juglans regia]